MISKSYRKNKSVFWIPIVIVLVLSAGLYTGNVLSAGDIKRTVTFSNDTEWDISEESGPTWLTNQDRLTFTVNLTEDYENYLKSLEPKPDPDPGTDPEPDPGEPENPNPENGETPEAVATPTEGTEPTQEEPVTTPTEGTEPTPEEPVTPPEVKQPFKVTVGEEQDQATVQVNKTGDPFNGIYEVVVTLPSDLKDKEIPVTLDFAENDWNIPTETRATFNIDRDKTKPGITFNGVTDNELIEYADAQLEVEFNDKNFDASQVIVDVKQDDNDYVVENMPDWTSGKGTITFTQAGDYKVTVTTTDKAGNSSLSAVKEFSIYKRAAEFKIKNKRDIPFYNHDVEIDVENDIRMQTFEVEINGEKLSADSPKFSKGWKKAHIKLTDPGYYEVKVKFTDRKQDTPYEMGPYKFTIDKTKPVVSVSDVTNGSIYKEPQKFKISVLDENENQDESVLFVKRNGQKYLEVNGKDAYKEQEISEDGVYEVDVKAVDRALNEDNFSPITFTIDQKAPVLSISNVSDKGYYNSDQEVVMTVVDELNLDLTKTKAVIEEVGDLAFSADVQFKGKSDTTAEASYKFTDDGEYIITLTSTDKAGNAALAEKVGFTIDKIQPKIEIKNVENHERYNEDQPVTIIINDVNLAESNVKVTQNGNPYEIAPLTKDGQTASTEHVFTEDGVYKIEVEAKDKAGNPNSETLRFTIDKNGPEIQYSIKDGAYFNNPVVDLTVSVLDYTPFLPEITVIREHEGEKEEIETGDWMEEVIWLISQQKTITLQNEGIYSVNVTAKDFFGVESTKELTFTIDHTPPEINISGIANEDYVQGNNELIVNINDLHFDETKNEVLVNGKPVKDAKWNKTATGYQFKQSFPDDGEYEVIVRSEDFAGNKAVEKKHKFTVDNVKPKISIENVEDGKYYDKKRTATIKVNELNFKNNHVEVTVNNKPYEWKNQGVESSIEIPFNEDGDYVIKVSAKDAAGNIADAQEKKFTIDESYPALNITGVDHMTNYNVDKQVSFEVNDANIDKTSIRVMKNGKAYEVGAPAQSRTKASLTHTFKEEGSYVLNFNATDKSGNKTTHDEIAFIIDKTNPVVKIDGVDHQSFNPTGKRVTVSVDELNFGTNYVVLSVTKDGKVFNIGTWQNNNKLSSLGYNFNDDGLYTIAISAEDKAGNGPIAANKTFTIDTTKPTIEITGVENAAHYNVDKPVSVSIRDVNLDVNRITVTRNGRGYNAGGFAVSNQTARLSHNFSQEGDYVINVEAIDKAGNQFSNQIAFTIDKTPPVITPKFKGLSRVIKDGEYINEVFTPEFALDQADDTIVSVTMNGSNVTGRIPTASLEMTYKFSVLARDKAGNESTIDISFILDTTKPTLNITGVIDGFFNQNQSPSVTYSDRYLDTSRSKVTLNGRPYVNGMVLSDEGDYTLKAEIFDLANNVSTRTIVFTIDKTSPVIRFKEPISNKFFNETLIPELLIEDLSAYDIISLTLNGQPYNLGDPIEEEGKHVLFFEVKDKAGNIQQLSVEFIIDKTPPKVNFEGVKKNKTYRDPVTLSISLDNPSDTLKSVMINGELFNGDVKEVDGTKVVTVTLSDINKYKVEVLAFDEAGNENNEAVEFEIVEKSVLVKFYENKTLFAGTMVGLVGAAAAGAVALRRSIIRRRDAKDM
ncbi:Ig-like domain-containing protein [Bacillus sp. HNG]|uniref:Ig-like domain-containing protein n=1 Tax=Bacillus sp. HNG TaxID=2293325 RepID=UPI001CB91429|nr:Ig-like domain-containing protein [Bacillus sp. HNG]